MERYNAIVKYKTSFYSFYLPIALSMYMVSDYIVSFILNASCKCMNFILITIPKSSFIHKCHEMQLSLIMGLNKFFF